MDQGQIKIIITGLKALKDSHFYSEVLEELEDIEKKYELSIENEFDLKKLKAESIYQNKQIPQKERFKSALEILTELKDNFKGKVNDQKYSDFLCLIGAVYKRKYQINKNLKDLYKGIEFYNSALRYIENDGYGAVNAIFLYKTLLKEHIDILSKSEIKRYNRFICVIRKKAIKDLDDRYKGTNRWKGYWIDRTYAELYFSDEKYNKAKKYLKKDSGESDIEKLEAIKDNEILSLKILDCIKRALDIRVSETRDKLISVEQLIRLYKLQNDEIKEEDFKFLEGFFENFIDRDKVKNIIRSVLIGKMGLALSGGGFRASFFHIGVFARLAELDMLKDIEVISTVSGGSIIGMMYYIRLKELLESKENSKIEQKDYIKLVDCIQKDFFNSVKKNIRMKAFSAYNPLYKTVTQELGNQYQKEFYGLKVTKMNELYISPKIDGENIDNFNPHFNSFELSSKVPILVVNSTCLNNGHNWRFTASGMGESQYMYDTTIDKNTIHKYTRYEDLKNEKFKNFTIAEAVASSSCVPGLFDPIELNEIYKPKETIKLIDGGIYDNQGLASLLDEDCTLIICSDASGHFSDEDDPSSCRLSMLSRVKDSLMDRSRDQEYELLKDMYESQKINGLCILHLKQCFDVKEVTPFNQIELQKGCAKDIYNINLNKEVQEKLAKVRTDLDSFNEAEAYALMNSGYTMMVNWFYLLKQEQKIWENYSEKTVHKWDFKKIRGKVFNYKKWVLEKLDTSTKLFLKVNPLKASIGSSLVLALLVLFLYCFLDFEDISSLLMWFSIFIIGAAGLYKGCEKCLYSVFKYLLKGILYPVAKFNLWFLNSKYIDDGKV